MGRLAFPNAANNKAAHNLINVNAMAQSLILPYDITIQEAHGEYSFVLCDPRLPDHPIVYASEGFFKMTGYSAREVLGKNCRFLQGPDTDRRTVLEIRDAIREERPCHVRILNYTKQGRAFWNLFHLAPLYSRRDGTVVHFVGVQTPLSLSFVDKLDNAEVIFNSLLGSAKPEWKEDAKAVTINSGNTEGFHAGAQEDGHIMVGQRDELKSRLRGMNVKKECEVKDEDKREEREAATAVRSVLSDIIKSSKTQGGVAEQRFICLAESAAMGVICSSLMLSLTQIQQSFVLADPNLSDMPIVHASDMFLRLTGYAREEVMGRNCKFLQGPDTDLKSVQKIRESIKESRPCGVRILNYRKDKQPFWNLLYVAPVRGADGKVAYYVGVQLDVTLADTHAFEGKATSVQMRQLGAVGAIRVAVRGLQGCGLRRSQKVPHIYECA
uniref:Putative LOV domain-containing protein n=1 Tax=Dendrolycopodium obscurum TaxID=62333 RepID=A0A126X3R8_DENOS|nr:putative LOV domain-containing protein [Dendrolycopodium obscurum]